MAADPSPHRQSPAGAINPFGIFRYPLVAFGTVATITGAVMVSTVEGWLGSLPDRLFPPPLPETEIRALIFNRLETRQALHTAQQTLTAIVTSEQERRLGHLYLGETTLVYQGIGYAQAAIDISQVEIERVDRSRGQIDVLLPPAYLAGVELDVERSGILEEHRAWIAPNAETQLYAEAERIAVARMRAVACQGDLFERAERQAETLLRDILRAARYTQISIETQPADRRRCQLDRAIRNSNLIVL